MPFPVYRPWNMTILLHPGAYQMSAMSPKICDEERENKPQCKQGSTSPPSDSGLLSLEAQSTPLWGLRGEPPMQIKCHLAEISHFAFRPGTPWFPQLLGADPGPTISPFCPN